MGVFQHLLYPFFFKVIFSEYGFVEHGLFFCFITVLLEDPLYSTENISGGCFIANGMKFHFDIKDRLIGWNVGTKVNLLNWVYAVDEWKVSTALFHFIVQ